MQRNIYIITLAPAIDYILWFDNFQKTKTNRPFATDKYAAGKGIHISMLLNSLDQMNESIIFTKGCFENFFLKDLEKNKINFKNFNATQDIRINLKIIDNDQTESSAKAPEIDYSEINKMKNYLLNKMTEKDILILTGSVPTTLGDNIYQELGQIAQEKRCLLIIDAFGPLLINGLTNEPFLIKPNVEELAQTTNMQIKNKKDIIKASNIMLKLGAKNVLVSNGNKGAILINKEKIYFANIPKTNFKLNNAAGSGDSMLAGFVKSYLEENDFTKALKWAVLSGSATAFSRRIADKAMMKKMVQYLDTINIKIINNTE